MAKKKERLIFFAHKSIGSPFSLLKGPICTRRGIRKKMEEKTFSSSVVKWLIDEVI